MKAFTQRNPSGTYSLHVRRSFISEMPNVQWTAIQMAIEPWAIWRNDIVSSDPTVGWEFPQGITEEMIHRAFKNIAGAECESA